MAIVTVLASKPTFMAIVTALVIETDMAIVTVLALKPDIKCKEFVPGWIF